MKIGAQAKTISIAPMDPAVQAAQPFGRRARSFSRASSGTMPIFSTRASNHVGSLRPKKPRSTTKSLNQPTPFLIAPPRILEILKTPIKHDKTPNPNRPKTRVANSAPFPKGAPSSVCEGGAFGLLATPQKVENPKN